MYMLVLLIATFGSLAPILEAQTYSNIVGYDKLGAYNTQGNYLGSLSNSDTLVSLPFTRPPAYTGEVQSVANNVVTVSGSPGWANSEFVYNKGTQPNTYYALIGANSSGPADPKEGCIYEVTGNTTNSISLALNGDSITAVPANSQITLIPYWTLSTLFPPVNANASFTPTLSTRNLATEVLIPNYAAIGVNLAYSETYYFLNSGANVGWRLFGDAVTTDHGDDVLAPNSYFVVRNANAAPTLPLVVAGDVLTGKVTTYEITQASQAQDNDVALIRPVAVTLNNSGLNPAGGSFVSTSSTRSLQDQLLVYNNAQTALNKSPSATYFYFNNAWRLFGDSTTADHGSDLIPSGSALTIRKAATGTGYTVFWQNSPTY